MSKTIADTHKLILDKHLNDIKALYAEHEIGRDKAIMGL